MTVRTALVLGMMLCPVLLPAQPLPENLGSCTLKDYVYTCDSAAFMRVFSTASAVTLETQNTDRFSRDQLSSMLVKKYGKQVLPQTTDSGPRPELIFLIVPVGVEGINISPGEPVLGTLRVYSAGATGTRERLLWAETYNGPQDLPWPAVVRALILKFQKHFPPK